MLNQFGQARKPNELKQLDQNQPCSYPFCPFETSRLTIVKDVSTVKDKVSSHLCDGHTKLATEERCSTGRARASNGKERCGDSLLTANGRTDGGAAAPVASRHTEAVSDEQGPDSKLISGDSRVFI